jgi:hypothetical protein
MALLLRRECEDARLRILFAEFQSRVRSQAGPVKAVKAVKVLEYKAPAAFSVRSRYFVK